MDLPEGPISLNDFLEEAELQQYYGLFREYLKVIKTTQLKYVNSDDLTELGLSKPEQRRYNKIYTKYFGKHYLSKIKRLLSTRKINRTSITATIRPRPPSLHDSSTKISVKHMIAVDDITINKELGTGQFGVVQQGTWTNGEQRIQVAIKCLGRGGVPSESSEFLKEAAVMHSISHPNVVRLYGVVLHLDSLMLVTELAPLRSLLECLKEFTLRENFQVTTLCNFAEQICDGMTYLESKRLIHRDLAARNILVFSKNKVKISDFGLSRALGSGKNYYQSNYNVNLKLPIAWCAPESISYLKFTSASDVWAFAVTLWEMFSYGFQPWAGFSGTEILNAIDAPNYQRLERPECCPEEHYATMLQCWAHEPASRPRFHDLGQLLARMQPEQVTAKAKSPPVEGRRTNLLKYRAGDLITVVGKERLTKCNMWSGVLPNGICGLFDPENTTPAPPSECAAPSPSTSRAARGGLLASALRSSLMRGDARPAAARRPTISSPRGDVKHTGHVGLDGAHFGDVAFLAPASCAVVGPYRPSEDLEEVPLINPNSPSHLTGGAGVSSTPPYHMAAAAAATPAPAAPTTPAAPATPAAPPDRDEVDDASRGHHNFRTMPAKTSKSFISKVKSATLGKSSQRQDCLPSTSKDFTETPHDYQEIADNVTSALRANSSDSLGVRRSQSDFSQSLLQEMEEILSNTGAKVQQSKKCKPASPRSQTLEKKRPNMSEIVKPMSAHEQKTLETAVALANELTTRSMNDLDSNSDKVPPSPSDRSKFHFRFPSIGHAHTSQEQAKEPHGKQERRNFSQEAQSVPDLQSTITEECRMAYASLIEQRTPPEGAATSLPHPAPRRPRQLATVNRSPSAMDSEFHADTEDKYGAHGHDAGALPLPSRGTKPALIARARHVRVHPLVLSAPAAGAPAPPERAYQNVRAAPRYVNLAGGTESGVDVCDGPSARGGGARDDDSSDGGEAAGGALELNDLRSLHKDAPEHVSVEDLLEFADLKPAGRQRGAESDEVRILTKVLSYEEPKVTEAQCLRALDYTEWRVPAALQALRLRAEAGGARALGACARALHAAGGDYARALDALAAADAPRAPSDP